MWSCAPSGARPPNSRRLRAPALARRSSWNFFRKHATGFRARSTWRANAPAWLAAGGYAAQLPARAALNLNVILALHYGVENLPEPLAFVNSTEPAGLNGNVGGRVNSVLEMWLILRQARNYCLATKLPWPKKRVLPAVFAAALTGHRALKPGHMAAKKNLTRWLREQRTSTRLAYAMQLCSRVGASFTSLIWTRLLVGAMGLPLNGVLIAFQKLIVLGGLGDLGIGGAVAIRTGQYLGRGDEAGLKNFLASARSVFLLLALVVGGGVLVLSPWLPKWLGYRPVPGIAIMSATNSVPLLEPGRPYLLGVTNSGAVPAAFSLEVDFGGATGTNVAGQQFEQSSGDSANRAAISLVDRIPATNTVPANSMVCYTISVPPGATGATNILMLNSGRAALLFNQHALPGTADGDAVLIPNLPAGGTGSLTLLFAVGAVLIAGVMLSSYLTNLNYACGNVTWPVVPAFVLLQIGLLGQWLVARQHLPLWVQYLPAVATAAAALWLYRLYISKSHPALAGILPLKLDWRMAATLAESSFWVYLCSLGNAIYRTTDSQVINAGFPAGTLPVYEYNYKFCDIVVFLALTAGFVSLPKITRWMASTEPRDQERVRVEMRRLNQFQTLLGCGAALAYLAVNNLFMKIWWLHSANPVPPVALGLQTAFALNMAITASGDTGIQLSTRSGKNGLRVAGLLIGLTGLLNVALSIVAMEMGSLWGIAMATVLAQSLLSVGAGYYTCRHLRVPWVPWLLKGWLIPRRRNFARRLAANGTAALLRPTRLPALEYVAARLGLFGGLAGGSVGLGHGCRLHPPGTRPGPHLLSLVKSERRLVNRLENSSLQAAALSAVLAHWRQKSRSFSRG